jgi:hypothetical protein
MNNQWEKVEHIDENTGNKATTNPTLMQQLTQF